MFDILRQPDFLHLIRTNGMTRLSAAGGGEDYGLEDTSIRIASGEDDVLRVELIGRATPIRGVHLRWNSPPRSGCLYLRDSWCRSEAEQAWRTLVPEEIMPWYFLVHDGAGARSHGIGVKTNGNAFCSWQVDPEGISLWIDTRNGGEGFVPGGRRLVVAEVVTVSGAAGQKPFAVGQALCRRMASEEFRPPAHTVYGGNNWYYAYGHITEDQCVDDAARIAQLSAGNSERPYMLVDDGWQIKHQPGLYNAGPWHEGNEKFRSLPRMAERMRAEGTRPGLWYRPLPTVDPDMRKFTIQTPARCPWAEQGKALDPTIPEAAEQIRLDARRIAEWGFELIKHDFTTVDLLGSWQHGSNAPTVDPGGGWHFHDRTLTNAEIVKNLYRMIKDCGSLILGCQTVGHLGLGTIDIQRQGGDVDGRGWERTRRMGPNALAFRMPQHNAFFLSDADCAPVTPTLPWSLSRQWLDLLARSGTPLFVSVDPKALNREVRAAISDALAIAGAGSAPAEPLDWLETACPRHWRFSDGTEKTYDWLPEASVAPPGLTPGDPARLLEESGCD
ncbi:MAG: hypothetical protein ACOC4K_04125 [Verrucomicrobiota bacterium]